MLTPAERLIPTISTILTHLFSIAYGTSSQFVPFSYHRLTEFAFLLTFAPFVMALFVYTQHTVDCAQREGMFWRPLSLSEVDSRCVERQGDTGECKHPELGMRRIESPHDGARLSFHKLLSLLRKLRLKKRLLLFCKTSAPAIYRRPPQ